MLRGQAVAPRPGVRAGEHVLVEPLGEVEEVPRVALAERERLTARVQPLSRVLADRVQHVESPLAAGAEAVDEEALPREREELRRRRPADLLRGFDRAAAGEDAQPREEQLLLGREQ